MKALSVRQPWAWAIMHGGKRIENRTWQRNYSGWLLIHASAGLADAGALTRVNQALEQTHRLLLRPEQERALPRGAIVGMANVIYWGWSYVFSEYTVAEEPQVAWLDSCTEHCLLFREVVPLKTPVPCRGQLGLWTPPPDVLQAVVEQTRGLQLHLGRQPTADSR